jgi:hypothetical protein
MPTRPGRPTRRAAASSRNALRTDVRRSAENQLRQLETLLKVALDAVNWRDSLRYEISRALAAGCTLEHLAAVTGFDAETIERLRREPNETSTAGTPPTRTHPVRSSSTGNENTRSWQARCGTSRQPPCVSSSTSTLGRLSSSAISATKSGSLRHRLVRLGRTLRGFCATWRVAPSPPSAYGSEGRCCSPR